MKDPGYTASWSDTLSFRVQYQETRTLLTNYDVDTQNTGQAARVALDASSGSVKKEPESNNSRSECRVMHSTPESLTALQSLPSTSLVLLLTPVITPANVDKSATKATSTDPFESLGRELSKQHHRLRHVPYLPTVGMTETHAAFIDQAAAVIVVICEPNASDGGQSLKQQRSFADDVVIKQLEDLSDDEDDESKAPFVLIRFDSKTNSRAKDDYKNVLNAPALTVTSAKEAAQLLFETEQ
jgi:hypothetical protein